MSKRRLKATVRDYNRGDRPKGGGKGRGGHLAQLEVYGRMMAGSRQQTAKSGRSG